ncbi:MAG: hypothetical protein U9N85_10290, partial [Bacteroidota bacterium]|nr:hypothetical protein [Bacteroidota bacterium]
HAFAMRAKMPAAQINSFFLSVKKGNIIIRLLENYKSIYNARVTNARKQGIVRSLARICNACENAGSTNK